MLDLFISAFVTFFVVIDPPGCAPIYASLTKGASAAQRRNMAIRAALIAAAILLIFALFGDIFLMFKHEDFFLLGLGSFLIMQLLLVTILDILRSMQIQMEKLRRVKLKL